MKIVVVIPVLGLALKCCCTVVRFFNHFSKGPILFSLTQKKRYLSLGNIFEMPHILLLVDLVKTLSRILFMALFHQARTDVYFAVLLTASSPTSRCGRGKERMSGAIQFSSA